MKAIFDNINGACTIEGNVPREIVCTYDAKDKVLAVARDKIGIQSLYYAQLPTSVIVSTELKDILSHIAYPKINLPNLAQAIRYNFSIDLQQTWIEQIKRVRAGEELTIDEKGIRSRIYWKRDHTPTFKGTKQEALAEALRLLRNSIKNCIGTSMGPVAVLLSGGIDSTSLAALTKEIQQEVHVFSAGYKGNKYTYMDERKVAKKFAEENGLIYHDVELGVNDFQKYLHEMIPYLDEPCFDVNSMVQYALFKKVSELGFKTVLMGLGGDELFYSYTSRHKEVEAIRLRREFIQLYPIHKHKKEYIHYLLENYRNLLSPTNSIHIDEMVLTDWTYRDYRRFAADAMLDGDRFADVDVHFSWPLTTTIQHMYDFVSAAFAINMCVYMAKKLCGANHLDVRFPILSSELVEFMDSLPLDMKFDINKPKQFQKEMMKGILPDYILYAKKRAFEPPFEFIQAIASIYQYKHISASYCFFNSMVADGIIDNLFYK